MASCSPGRPGPTAGRARFVRRGPLTSRRPVTAQQTTSFEEGPVISGMEHIGLCADNPKMLVEWYVKVLGFRIVRALEEHRTYFVRAADGGMLEVYPAKHPSDPADNIHRGLRHIALSACDVDAEVARLRSAGVLVPAETIVITPDMKLAFFSDPEGNLLHLVERKMEIPP